MSNIVSINAQNLQQVLGETSQQKLVLLNFFSPQSPDCIGQAAILDKVAAEYASYIVVANLDCDAEQALASQLAQQVGLQTLPTLVLLKDSAPVDLLAGVQSEAQIREALAKHLPAQQDLLLEQAKQALLKSDLNAAFNYAKQAYEIDSGNARIKLVLADICIQIHKVDEAQALINTIDVQEQDAYFNNIKAKCEAALEAKDSPEIKEKQQQVEKYPNDLELKEELSILLNEAGRKEEALDILFTVLQKDLNFNEAKPSFLAIIASLPDGDALAAKYRRKLYSILY
ncbi:MULTISPECIES: tetratricopeptide repeat protein [Pseudoalteromonas]|uniref:tetratricopeptide repeat protein n=1 Tax=Pseudoalteromonas TaxID=53246 RepID=UPI000C32762D|nr:MULTISPECIES: tetratricopeptide repeat protein [Pseudoalteromonas]MBG9993338.1 tetratricopeptide repeat protein [Pseudoalteromonas sp. NZS37]MBH0014013.1 tetratricopeptide repeat protein [Pseudoalteromonas sp. NZS100_1]MBH0043645.1 tetratricopeptide repeat protein [Pseudoalteromonas sp. SWXJZ10B]MBH0048440.1 tetratricopeptide repeat protein [Pseudoalteromonas sp. NZS11_1]MBH0049189.1 tetratricopeptide repeat protein [Pseudoalteromonas sp. SWYJZ19]